MISKKRKEAMAVPVEPLQDNELCAYELFGERNIKERQQAMADVNFLKIFPTLSLS